MSGLFILISVITGTASFIALIRPLPGLWLPTRKRAFAVWIVSFLLLGIGTPDSVETPPVIAIEPLPEPEPEPVPGVSDPSQVEDMSDAEKLTVIASPEPQTAVASLGVSRDEIVSILAETGLEMYSTDYPLTEPNLKATTASTVAPNMDVEMIGPDNSLNEVSLIFYPSFNERDQHFQGVVSVSLLSIIFPEWDGVAEWFTQALLSGQTVTHVRNDHDITVTRLNDAGTVFLVITGRELRLGASP